MDEAQWERDALVELGPGLPETIPAVPGYLGGQTDAVGDDLAQLQKAQERLRDFGTNRPENLNVDWALILRLRGKILALVALALKNRVCIGLTLEAAGLLFEGKAKDAGAKAEEAAACFKNGGTPPPPPASK